MTRLNLQKLLFLVAVFITNQVSAQNLVINEGYAYYPEQPKDIQLNIEWIELYNSSEQQINLFQYTLSFTDDTSQYWPIEYFSVNDSLLASNEFIVIDFEGNKKQIITSSLSNISDTTYVYLMKMNDKDAEIADSLLIYPNSSNITTGKYPDGYDNNYFFQYATPGSKNSEERFLGVLPEAVFNKNPGIYFQPETLIWQPENTNASMFYTIDGSKPDTNAILYENHIVIDSTTVLRTLTYLENYIPGPVSTSSYIIRDSAWKLPVISISSEDNDLSSLCMANDSLTANMELLFPEQGQILNTNTLLYPTHECKNDFPVKTYIQFGPNNLANISGNFLSVNKKRHSISKLLLSSVPNTPGIEIAKTMLTRKILSPVKHVDIPGRQPAFLYLNGKTAGLVFLEDTIRRSFIADFYQIREENITIYSDLNTDYPELQKMKDLVKFANFSQESTYTYFQKKIDIHSFIDFIILSAFFHNKNQALPEKAWYDTHHQTKLKYVLPAKSITLSGHEDNPENTFMYLSEQFGSEDNRFSYALFEKLMDNQVFRQDFSSRFFTQMELIYHPDRINRLADSVCNKLVFDTLQIAGSESFLMSSETESTLDSLSHMLISRKDMLVSDYLEYINANDSVYVRFVLNDTSQGEMYLEKILLRDSVTEIVIPGNTPLSFETQHKNGFQFNHWTGIQHEDSIKSSMKLTFTENATVSPVFIPPPDVIINEIHYNAAQGKRYDFLELYNPQQDDTTNLSGFYFEEGFIGFEFPDSALIPPKGFVLIVKDSSLFADADCQIFQLQQDGLSDFGESFMLMSSTGDTVDRVDFTTNPPWPQLSAGQGPSMTLKNPASDNSVPQNWISSPFNGGSPGKPNINPDFKHIRFNELALNDTIFDTSDTLSTSWVELYNPAKSSISLNNLVMKNISAGGKGYSLKNHQDTTILPGDFLTIIVSGENDKGYPEFPIHQGDTIILSYQDAETIDSIVAEVSAGCRSTGYYRENPSELACFKVPTQGSTNTIPLLFSSVPRDTITEGYTYEYEVKVLHYGESEIQLFPVQLPGWLSSDNDSIFNSLLTATPASSDTGAHKVSLMAWDGLTEPVYQNFTITVFKKPEPPEPPDSTNVSTNKKLSAGFRLYPVPASEHLHLSFDSWVTDKLNIEIFDINGKSVSHFIVKNPKRHIILSVNNIPNGLYVLKAYNKQFLYQNTFVKQ